MDDSVKAKALRDALMAVSSPDVSCGAVHEAFGRLSMLAVMVCSDDKSVSEYAFCKLRELTNG